ncbi:MAG: hypothetical protein HRF46_05420 [Acidobacteriota bacterium]|jgi:hypothetical protein
MQRPSPAVLCALLLAVLLPLFYPALGLERRLAPEAALHSVAPWRSLLGPFPRPSPLAVEAASSLGPRLAAIARDPAGTALWNPWVGGGRGGWLASAGEGGTPLVVAAALLARPPWRWTALLALTVTVGLTSTFWLVRLLGFPPAAAAVGAAAYALSGAASSTWLTFDGAALALGPLLLVPVVHPSWSDARRAGSGAVTLALLHFCGAQAVQFMAAAAALLVAAAARGFRPSRRWAWPLLAAVLALAMLAPRLWLAGAASEPGALPPPPSRSGAPGLASTVVPFSRGEPLTAALEPSPPSPEALRTAQAAFIGAAVIVLAVVGALAAFPVGGRAFWLGVTVTAALLAHRPEGLSGVPGLIPRPFGVAALGFAVLAAAGTHLLARRLPSAAAGRWVGAAVVGIVLLRLLPPAAHGLPFAPPSAAVLADPLDAVGSEERGARLVAFGATLPPDTAAAFALADLRGANLAAEPRYAAALRPRPEGMITFDRILDPALPRLGARLLVEPAQLHVVSAELFSRTVAVPGRRLEERESGRAAVAVNLPEGVVRLALPTTGVPVDSVTLLAGGLRHDLRPDPSLAQESDAWNWFAVPAGVPPGEGKLLVRPGAAMPGEPTLLWDTSGLLLLGERGGARTWLATSARPMAFVARALAPEGGVAPTDPLTVSVAAERLPAVAAATAPGATQVHVAHVATTRVAAQVHSEAPRLLVMMIKHRPSLWHARVNGQSVASEVVDGLWTALVVPRGTSFVEMEAHLPIWVVLSAAAGLAGSVWLCLLGRPRAPRVMVGASP